MALDPTIEEQKLLAETFSRDRSRLTMRERVTDSLAGAGLFGVVVWLWTERPPGSFPLLPAALCLLIFIAAARVRFDTPLGFAPATQVAFVPLIFALPLAIAPLAVMAGLALSQIPDVLRGEIAPLRVLRSIPNSWFCVGPVAVLCLAHSSAAGAGAGWLLLAFAGQLVVDFAAYYGRSWLMREAGVMAQLRESWTYGVDAALSVIGLLVAAEFHSDPVVALAPLPLLGLLAMFGTERHRRLEGMLELNDAYRGTALVLGDVVEADDGYTGEHCRMVVGLALAVAAELGLDAAQRRDVEFGALLHDVGKVAVPKEIVNKPGKLTEEEWRIMKTHTIEGQRMLDHVGGFMRRVGLVVRSHHERWDGGGYPDGLIGECIPLPARIVTCCDSWNAMRTDRSYRSALTFEAARSELLANAGTQFDPRVVDAFLSAIGSPDDEAQATAGVTPLPALVQSTSSTELIPAALG
jgi:putative nucleotidyltransferase with HDIG domain